MQGRLLTFKEGGVKVRDGAVVVGPFDVQAQGGAVRGVADAALQEGVRLHVGVACLELGRQAT